MSTPVLGDDNATLPRRVRWTVTPSLPAETIREVRFFVDGQRVWSDSEPPYTYGEPGAYLVPSYFASYSGVGRHRFAVEVVGWNGSAWRERVLARVPKPQIRRESPAYGIWSRLSAATLKNPPPPGKWVDYADYTAHLHFVGGGLWVGRTEEHAFAYEVAVDAKTFRVNTPIFFGSRDVGGTSAGWTFKGYQCAPDGPPSTYTWSYRKGRYLGRFNGKDQYATYLVLKARKEPCEPRRKILEGVWEFVD